MEDRPSAEQLLAAARAFLTETAMPQLTGHAAFHARVAGNVLDIVARELALAPGFAKAEQARLSLLLGETGDLVTLNRKLCEQIAAGEMDLSNEALKTHLIKVTMGKLAIDQPGYQGYKIALANGWPEEDVLEA
ncbi:MAG: hypothetical protein ISQ19_02575 [PS1 clade bacterium]|uniref:DUF6285 domain-containing protein n=1 Tax=PS1 clade bacterium TaxID=2175152 RepID=A0A937L550_9PROT|nr:hypothetical protein [PS1 clade bacterium]